MLGYWLITHGFEPAPLLLGMVLGQMMEENLRRAMLISRRYDRVRLAAVGHLLAVATVLLILSLLPMLRKKREEAFVESEN